MSKFSAIVASVPEGRPTEARTSWLFNSLTRYEDLKFLAFMTNDFEKAQGHGELFADLAPDAGGGFQIELAIVLSEFLPPPRDVQEYDVDVRDEDGAAQRLVVSNQMMKRLWVQDGEPVHVLHPRWWRGAHPSIPVPPGAGIQYLKSMVSWRTHIRGERVELAFPQTHATIRVFISLVNALLVANLAVRPLGYLSGVPQVVSMHSFGEVYFMLRGADPSNAKVGRVGPNAALAAATAGIVLEDEDMLRMKQIALGVESPDVADIILRHAVSSEIAGQRIHALLECVIASEVAVGAYVTKCMLEAEVSKSTLGDYGRDLKYGLEVNLILPLILQKSGQMPDKRVVAAVNRGRQLRNKVMHEGLREVDHEELRTILRNTEEFVKLMRSLWMKKEDKGAAGN